jgi:hypothetical protein
MALAETVLPHIAKRNGRDWGLWRLSLYTRVTATFQLSPCQQILVTRVMMLGADRMVGAGQSPRSLQNHG